MQVAPVREWEVRAVDTVVAADELMRPHAGRIELESRTRDRMAHVRFEAFCACCLYHPAMMTATIQSHLMQVPGMTDIVVPGTRVSEAAARRIVELGLTVRPPSCGSGRTREAAK